MPNQIIGAGMAAVMLSMLATQVEPGSSASTKAQPVAAQTHDRLLPLQGGRNFRDLGGYRTADGRRVKWGLLFRSGSMHSLTEADYVTLGKRGIRVVCDFRDTRERASEPVNWPSANGQYGAAAFIEALAQLGELLPAGRAMKQRAAQALFQRDDMLAHHLRRHAQCGACGGEGTKVRCLHEGGHSREPVKH